MPLGCQVSLIVCALMGSLLSMFGLNFGIADLLLCAVGLLIFMGLTAYDTQMLKYYYSYFGGDARLPNFASSKEYSIGAWISIVANSLLICAMS